MRYYALASDYDGTLAHHGRIDAATLDALQAFKASGRKIILVTGRILEDLFEVFPEHAVCDRIVAENGAVLYDPQTRAQRPLAAAPPHEFVERLQAEVVAPLAIGRVIVATWEPHETTVLETIRDLGLELQVIFNKGAVMVLPAGVNKASGLQAALDDLGLSAHNVVAAGDAENDHALLTACECGVAVANALPALKEHADWVTPGDHGVGVSQIVAEVLRDDLADIDARTQRHDLILGEDAQGAAVCLKPYRTNILLAGTSGSGKSTFATSFLERLQERRYQYCIIDPEGDYDHFVHAVTLGDAQRAPTVEEALRLLSRPDQNIALNLLGVPLGDRPRFFSQLLAAVWDLRIQTGRPHWLVVDEAHHLLPQEWTPANNGLARDMTGLALIAVHPDRVARMMLEKIGFVAAIGDAPDDTLGNFARAIEVSAPRVSEKKLQAGEALAWRRCESRSPFWFRVTPPHAEHQRHIRKYAVGDLGDHSFYFRGPDRRLNLRAQNLMMFLQIGDGIDDATWLYHLQRGDYSRWFREYVKDTALAQATQEIEQSSSDAAESRARIRAEIEQRYTEPAN